MPRSPLSLLLLRLQLLLPLSAVTGFNNSCLLPSQLNPPTAGAPATFLADCAAWVINSTDAVWRPDATAAEVNRSLEAYFYRDWASLGSRGVRARGMAALKDQVWRTRRAFPDLAIHITDAFCAGNDVDGYKTAMPDVLTGTNRGPSGYGPATGRRAAYNGIAVTYVQRVRGRWQYIAEWVVHDECAFLCARFNGRCQRGAPGLGLGGWRAPSFFWDARSAFLSSLRHACPHMRPPRLHKHRARAPPIPQVGHP